jgi:cell division protein FtsI/penicillin-binding protein 2
MRLLIVFLAFTFLTACTANTKLSGVVDPTYRDQFNTNKMIIVGRGMLLDEQKELENTLVENLSNYDVTVLRGLDVFPPTREYTETDIFEIANSKGADSLLVINLTSRDISEDYVPPTHHPGTTRSYVSGYGNLATVTTYTTPGYTTGGYSIDKPQIVVSIVLKNAKNKDTIWTADGFSEGHSSSFNDLINSVARESISELFSAGIITKKKQISEEE